MLGCDDFQAGGVDVGWLERTELAPRSAPEPALLAAAFDAALPAAEGTIGGWRSSGAATQRLALHGDEHSVALHSAVGSEAAWLASLDGGEPIHAEARRLDAAIELIVGGQRETWSVQRSRWGVVVSNGERSWAFTTGERDRSAGTRRRAGGSNAIHAPMPGTIVAVLVGEGDLVEVGQTLVVLEAMKMEHLLPAPSGGRVAAVRCAAGATVEEGELLIEVGADDA